MVNALDSVFVDHYNDVMSYLDLIMMGDQYGPSV